VIIARTMASTVSGTAASLQENEERRPLKLPPLFEPFFPAGPRGVPEEAGALAAGSALFLVTGPTGEVEVAMVTTNL
jgi:hypothetical protein